MARILFTLFLSLLTQSLWAAPPIQTWRAPSGAQVFFVETHVLPMVDVQISFAAGSAYDPPKQAGLAAMTHGLLDAGVTGLDEEHIAARFADQGTSLHGSLDQDRAALAVRTLSSAKELHATTELLAKVLQSPLFPASVLEREKARTIASIKEADTQPGVIAEKRFMATLYPNHPYGRRASSESIAALQTKDVQRFYQRHYSAKRAVISLVGDLSREQAEAVAQQLSARLPNAEADSPQGQALPEVSTPAPQLVKLPHPASQSHIFLGMPGIKRGHPDHFPLLVGNYILGGGGFNSRLTKTVREERGYAYSVYSYFMPLRQPGPFQIGLTTKRSQTQDALTVVRDTLSRFLNEGPSDEEVSAAKRNLADGFALRLDSNRKILEYLDLVAFYGLPLDYLDTFQAQVNAVTKEQIRAAFAQHVRLEALSTVIVAGDE